MKECPVCRRCFPDHVNHCPDDGDATTTSIAGEPILDGRYQLERRLGHGGMGVVFQARHIFLKTAHAIKVILPDLVGNDPMLVTRFRQEALAAAAIRHQNIIAVTDFGVVRGTMPFLVMEFVSGKSLHEMLAEEGALPPARALEIISAVGAGVSAAHRQGIVHRDLKPLNIMFQEGMSVAEGLKVLDFGLAKIKSGELLGSFVQAKTSGLMGSPFYMAPEQWGDEEPDARADIYSLGVILYQMLGGDVPFKGTSIPSIMKKHLTAAPPTFASLGIQVPPQIEAVVRHSLEKEAENRPATVEEFINELREAVDSISASLSRTSLSTPDSRQAQTIISPRGTTSIPPDSTTMRIRTNPPSSRVYINNVSVGLSDEAGLLVVPDMLRGEHRVHILHDGYAEWERQVECSGGVCDVEARLQSLNETSIPPSSLSGHQSLGDPYAGTISSGSLPGTGHQSQAAMEAQRLRQQAEALEEQARREEEEMRRQQEESLRLAREQQAREEEAARQKAADEEAARLRAEEEERARVAAEEERRKAEEEAARVRAEEEARLKAAEEARLKAEEEERLRVEAEAKRKAAEEAERLRAEEEERRLAKEEEERKAALEAARVRAAEEEAARLKAKEEERLRAEMEARRRAEEEEEARQRAEREAAERRAEEERKERERAEAAERETARQREREEQAARIAATISPKPLQPSELESTQGQRRGVITQRVGTDSLPGSDRPTDAWQGQQDSGQKRSSTSVMLIAAIAGVLLIGGGLGVWYMTSSKPVATGEPPRSPTPTATATATATATQTQTPPNVFNPELVSIPGGRFDMGRNDGAPQEGPVRVGVSVGSFYMDKTEVTNAEYARFIQESGDPAPSHWSNGKPNPGEELLPVVNVSYRDAVKFADWRSKRDGVRYRLPTEEEWEYAARGGDQQNTYPWGNNWVQGRAGTKDSGATGPKPVGSYPEDRTRWGVLDMAGNVYEWTSSRASLYPGSEVQIDPSHKSWMIVRGGAYVTDYKQKPPSTYRDWFDPSRKEAVIGFRLVRAGESAASTQSKLSDPLPSVNRLLNNPD
ncbi:MAG TPA: SUMF1/EgtB/PvdO family nonheme iron enzyme [Pyrinomonadaceae bacterium]|nr:SUMF1/EgtB/PvdO family nonheme iron enzyme [Pyrinomonadaceae bacterium]